MTNQPASKKKDWHARLWTALFNMKKRHLVLMGAVTAFVIALAVLAVFPPALAALATLSIPIHFLGLTFISLSFLTTLPTWLGVIAGAGVVSAAIASLHSVATFIGKGIYSIISCLFQFENDVEDGHSDNDRKTAEDELNNNAEAGKFSTTMAALGGDGPKQDETPPPTKRQRFSDPLQVRRRSSSSEAVAANDEDTDNNPKALQ